MEVDNCFYDVVPRQVFRGCDINMSLFSRRAGVNAPCGCKRPDWAPGPLAAPYGLVVASLPTNVFEGDRQSKAIKARIISLALYPKAPGKSLVDVCETPADYEFYDYLSWQWNSVEPRVVPQKFINAFYISDVYTEGMKATASSDTIREKLASALMHAACVRWSAQSIRRACFLTPPSRCENHSWSGAAACDDVATQVRRDCRLLRVECLNLMLGEGQRRRLSPSPTRCRWPRGGAHAVHFKGSEKPWRHPCRKQVCSRYYVHRLIPCASVYG